MGSVSPELRRVAEGLALAAAFLLAVLTAAGPIAGVHQHLVGWMLGLFGTSATAWAAQTVFGAKLAVQAPSLPIPHFDAVPDWPRLLLVGAVVVLALAAYRFKITRRINGFHVLLLVTSALVCAFDPSFVLPSAEVTRLWLRLEVLMWLALPCVGGFLYVTLRPTVMRAAAWMLAAQVYAVCFSALRLACMLTVMHHTGMLFFPLLWFVLGFAGSLLYVLVYYSATVRTSAWWAWGARGQ